MKKSVRKQINFRNLVKSNQIWIVITLFRLIWHQTEFRWVTNQSEKLIWKLSPQETNTPQLRNKMPIPTRLTQLTCRLRTCIHITNKWLILSYQNISSIELISCWINKYWLTQSLSYINPLRLYFIIIRFVNHVAPHNTHSHTRHVQPHCFTTVDWCLKPPCDYRQRCYNQIHPNIPWRGQICK